MIVPKPRHQTKKPQIWDAIAPKYEVFTSCQPSPSWASSRPCAENYFLLPYELFYHILKLAPSFNNELGFDTALKINLWSPSDFRKVFLDIANITPEILDPKTRRKSREILARIDEV
jgi:hypothetical protein